MEDFIFIGVDEYSKLTDIPKNTIYRNITANKIASTKIEGKKFIKINSQKYNELKLSKNPSTTTNLNAQVLEILQMQIQNNSEEIKRKDQLIEKLINEKEKSAKKFLKANEKLAEQNARMVSTILNRIDTTTNNTDNKNNTHLKMKKDNIS